jgi:hypothetical protein
MGSKHSRWFGWFGAKKAPPRPAAPANPYHAVSIVPSGNACDAAYRFAGQRFLSRQAPRLPLPSCDAKHCTCRFKHHKDQRTGPRRNSDLGMITSSWTGPERRERRGAGRRKEDKH